jgi:hypothetical protein
MPESALISLALRLGRLPGELEEALEEEPEYWANRLWIYVNAGGR